jgi:hypothetical protein
MAPKILLDEQTTSIGDPIGFELLLLWANHQQVFFNNNSFVLRQMASAYST